MLREFQTHGTRTMPWLRLLAPPHKTKHQEISLDPAARANIVISITDLRGCAGAGLKLQRPDTGGEHTRRTKAVLPCCAIEGDLTCRKLGFAPASAGLSATASTTSTISSGTFPPPPSTSTWCGAGRDWSAMKGRWP